MADTITSDTDTAQTVRIAARQARLVIDLIRGRDVAEALAILEYSPRSGSPNFEKVRLSEFEYAEHKVDLDATNLYVRQAYVHEGPTRLRFRPRE